MIRINLLGIPKARKGGKRSAAAVSVPGEGPGFVTLTLLGVVVTGAIVIGWYTMISRQHDKLEKDMQTAIRENQRLADVKAQYEASKAKADLFERRVKVIDQLKDQQLGPISLLNLVADTVSGTDAVWLETMTDDGKSIDFTGMALSPNAVADLMKNLRSTGAFKTVEIKETAQDNSIKELQAFKFELICEKGFTGKIDRKS